MGQLLGRATQRPADLGRSLPPFGDCGTEISDRYPFTCSPEDTSRLVPRK